MEAITSRENPRIKELARLLRKRSAREESGLFVCEGARLCLEALESGLGVRELYVTGEALERYPALGEAASRAGRVFQISSDVAGKLGEVKTPQGVYALCERLDNGESAVTIKSGGPGGKYVLLSSLQDPGNMGTILRTAEAFGADGLFYSDDCPDPYSPKVLRSSMGGIFRLPCARTSDMGETVRRLRQCGVSVYAAALDGAGAPLSRLAEEERAAVLIGNEGNGLSPQLVAACDYSVAIPMAGGAESLNAAVAAAVLIWEMTRTTLQ